MKTLQRQRNISKAAPPTDEFVYDNSSVYTHRSSRDVSKAEGSSISCLSMKSDRSKGHPPVFSCDLSQNDCEDPNGSQRSLHMPKDVGQRTGHLFEDHLPVEQSDDGLLRKLKLSLKHKYKPHLEGLGAQSTRVCLREGLSLELQQMDHTLTKQKSPLTCTDLFRASPGRCASLRSVLTTGSAGVGKTVLVHWSIVDWCEDRALQHIQLLCPLPFSQLNLLQHQSWTLIELLQTFCPGLRESGITDLHHYRMLFILDGLDECRLPLDFSTKNKRCDSEAPMSVDVLLTNLMLGNLLPEAQLWITSRPGAARSIPPTLIHRVTEVQGFNKHQKEAYFLQNIQDEGLARTVLANIFSSAALHSMCNLPLFCSITASACADTSSMTQMFLHFLSCHMMNMRYKYRLQRSRVTTVIQCLSKVAYQQLQKGELLFCEDHVKACGVTVKEALVYSGLCTQVFREDLFSFVHLSLQEFLAALFVHLFICGDKENLHGDLGDHPLFLQFLLELSLDSRVSQLTQTDIQRGVRPETY